MERGVLMTEIDLLERQPVGTIMSACVSGNYMLFIKLSDGRWTDYVPERWRDTTWSNAEFAISWDRKNDQVVFY